MFQRSLNYFVLGTADRDGNELQNLRREEDRRAGRIPNTTDAEHHRIGSFEKYTKVKSEAMNFSIEFLLFKGNRSSSFGTCGLARWSRSRLVSYWND